MTRRRKTAVYNEYRWQVCVRLNDPDSMSYFHISDTSSRGRNESMKVVELWKRNNQPHNSEDVFLCCLELFSSSPKRQNSFKISIIYHQMKFVVYVQVYLYTPRSMANKSLEVQKMPRGSAIATVRPFFLKILFNSTFWNFLTLYWTSINYHISYFPSKKFRNVMKYNFEKKWRWFNFEVLILVARRISS